MQLVGVKNDDGSLEMTIRLSREQAEALSRGAADASWGKTEYCVTCGKTPHKETFEAYGDIHANMIAFSICGGSFGLAPGRCR